MYKLEESLNDAQRLFNTFELENIVSFRIEHDHGSCCCSHCWPLVWQEVNELIHPQGIEHEGQALIEIEDERYILKQHESGPEIMLMISASVSLITSVVNLIVAICGSLRKEGKCPPKIKIVQRRFIHNQVMQELLVEINLHDAKITSNKMKAIIESAIKNTSNSKKK